MKKQIKRISKIHKNKSSACFSCENKDKGAMSIHHEIDIFDDFSKYFKVYEVDTSNPKKTKSKNLKL